MLIEVEKKSEGHLLPIWHTRYDNHTQ